MIADPAAAGAAAASATSAAELPLLRGPGAEQMACDERLLAGRAEFAGAGATAGLACLASPRLVARRYLWDPAAVSLGRFQELSDDARRVLGAAGLDVVRRPSGGRLVLHGEGFEWSFAVAWPAGALPYGTRAPYRLVHAAMAAALRELGAAPDTTRDEPYTRSSLCFASALRHDLLVAGAKAVAVAQSQRGGRCLVHGSVLERRPPARLCAAVEAATGERWRAEGLAAGGPVPDGATLWSAFLEHLASEAATR